MDKSQQRGFCTSGTRIWAEFWTKFGRPDFWRRILGSNFLLLLLPAKEVTATHNPIESQPLPSRQKIALCTTGHFSKTISGAEHLENEKRDSIMLWWSQGSLNGGVSRSGLVLPFLSFFVLFCPFLSFLPFFSLYSLFFPFFPFFPFLFLSFLSFFVLFGTFPIFLGFSRFARGWSGDFPD